MRLEHGHKVNTRRLGHIGRLVKRPLVVADQEDCGVPVRRNQPQRARHVGGERVARALAAPGQVGLARRGASHVQRQDRPRRRLESETSS
eukprot:1557555-Prymnesium_polylepis.2